MHNPYPYPPVSPRAASPLGKGAFKGEILLRLVIPTERSEWSVSLFAPHQSASQTASPQGEAFKSVLFQSATNCLATSITPLVLWSFKLNVGLAAASTFTLPLYLLMA